MKKILLLLFVIIVAAIIGATFSLGKIVKSGFETKAPEILGTSVSVGDVDISLLRGAIIIQNLVIGNPKGFQEKNAISIGKIVVKVNIASVLSEIIKINEISIIDTEINYEVTFMNTNIGTLLNNINRNSASSESSSSDGKPAKKVIIKDLYIKKTKVKAELQAEVVNKAASVELPENHITNIGQDGKGVTFAVASKKIMGSFVESLSKADTSQLTDSKSFGQGAKGVLNNFGSKLKGLFGK